MDVYPVFLYGEIIAAFDKFGQQPAQKVVADMKLTYIKVVQLYFNSALFVCAGYICLSSQGKLLAVGINACIYFRALILVKAQTEIFQS